MRWDRTAARLSSYGGQQLGKAVVVERFRDGMSGMPDVDRHSLDVWHICYVGPYSGQDDHLHLPVLFGGLMRRLILFVIFATFTLSPVLAQSKHPFTFEDMMSLKRIGEPVPSPDGKWVAFSAVDVDLNANTR